MCLEDMLAVLWTITKHCIGQLSAHGLPGCGLVSAVLGPLLELVASCLKHRQHY